MKERHSPWRLLPAVEGDGFLQMALDHALLESACREDSPPTLRFYRFEPPALTLGRFQHLRHVDLDACERLGIDVVRRPTGGKAILHKDDFTYSLVLPPSSGVPDSVEESYAVICRGIIEALRLLGLDAGLVPRTSYRLDGVHACFSTPAAADLAVGGRKLCGSAQTRRSGAVLQHGTILILDNSDLLFKLFDYPEEESRARREEFTRACACLRDLGVGSGWEDIAAAFALGFRKAFDVDLEDGVLSEYESRLHDSMLKDYTSTAWSQSL